MSTLYKDCNFYAPDQNFQDQFIRNQWPSTEKNLTGFLNSLVFNNMCNVWRFCNGHSENSLKLPDSYKKWLLNNVYNFAFCITQQGVIC